MAFQEVVFELVNEERVPNSPYSLEGSEHIILDTPPSRNLPPVCEIIDEDGNGKKIRYIRGCNTIDFDEQVKLGYPAGRKTTAAEFNDLTILNGQLIAKNNALISYLRAAKWMKGNNTNGGRAMYFEANPEQELSDLFDQQSLQIDLGMKLKTAPRAAVMDVLRLNDMIHAIGNEKNERLQAIKMLENESAVRWLTTNLDKIIAKHQPVEPVVPALPEGLHGENLVTAMMEEAAPTPAPSDLFESADNDLKILLSVAIENGVISLLQIPGAVAIKRAGKWTTLVDISDDGGQEEKKAKLLDYLKTTDGEAALASIKKGIENKK